MEPLRNPRHEKFAQCLFQGMSANRAYAEAGYSPHDGNCIRLRGNERIRERLAYLQSEAAKSAKITIESICEELSEATAVAKSKGQAQAMVSASALRAKLAGLLTEKIEIGAPGDFDNLTSTASIVDRVFERLIEQFKPVDEDDRQGFIALIERQLAEQQAYIDVINSRPLIASRVDARRLDVPWTEHEPSAPKSALRIGYKGNGSKPG